MKLATWNVNSIRVRLPQILQWLGSNQPDVLCLQETKVEDKLFPKDVFNEAGYQAAYSGQKTYNGVAIVTPTCPGEVGFTPANMDDSQKRVMTTTVDDIRIINVYVPNGSEVGSEKYVYKLHWLATLSKFIAEQMKQYAKVAVLGDFNIAPEDRDVHDPEAWRGSVLVSDKERQAFQSLLQLGFEDVFRKFDQAPDSFSWWDYRAAAFRRNLGLRIDHILCSTALANQCKVCSIDKTPRGWERPSDHTPVIAEF